MCGILCIIQKEERSNKIEQCLKKLIPRGPDKQNSIKVNHVYLGFTRLAIMDTSDDGLQPFSNNKTHVICNGEVYNYEQLAKMFNISMKSKCDCEVILPLYQKLGFIDMIKNLDSEFALIIYYENQNIIYAARDKYVVRPLFYGWNLKTNMYGFASEVKALHDIMEVVEPVIPNLYYIFDLNNFCIQAYKYFDYDHYLLLTNNFMDHDLIKTTIKEILTNAVKKRLHTDRPIGFLLSGGLDSSLIVSIASRILGPDNITCFSIGLENSSDVIASKVVAKYLGIKNHHIIPFDIETGINAIPEVIKQIESYDITTIRASTPQYIMAKYISTNTDIKVLLSGEGSDEIHGSYRYFRDAPNPDEFHSESIRLLKELYMFDNLRTDRTMSGNGLEVRVPFLDFNYVNFIMNINPEKLMYTSNQMEKQIIRDSFVGYLPDEILYRSKEAFSDAVSSTEQNWYKSIQKLASETINESDILSSKFIFNKPKTSEALYFRRIFDQFYPDRCNLISHYWLPKFQKEEIDDPSATVLQCY
jgi:asparagine synthase (glutamine-hydrolysing)